MSKYHVSKSSEEENGFEPVQTWVQILSQSTDWSVDFGVIAPGL